MKITGKTLKTRVFQEKSRKLPKFAEQAKNNKKNKKMPQIMQNCGNTSK